MVYRVGPRSMHLLKRYWYYLTMTERAGGYLGAPFKGQHIVPHGGSIYPAIFNVVEDALLWHWVSVVAATERSADTCA